MTPELDLPAIIRAWREEGYARLPRFLDEPTLERLRARADDLMLGRISYPGLFFQGDSPSGRYEDLEFGKGYAGPTLAYRKIEKLELDPEFFALITHPLFERIARAVIDGPIVIYRAMLFNKPARGGTPLPWHQDAGRFWGLDRDPELELWVALDDAPAEAGCVEVLPRTHKAGLATPLGGMIPADRVAERAKDDEVVALPARAGEGLVLHNLVWHRSGVNSTAHPRRAFSVCFMSATTRCLRRRRAPRTFVPVF